MASSATLRGFEPVLSARALDLRPREVLLRREAAETWLIGDPVPQTAGEALWERASYRPSSARRGVSAAASLLVVAGSLASLIALNGAVHREPGVRQTQIVSLQLTPPPPPKQPPAPTHQPQTLVKPQPEHAVAPTPLVVIPHPAPAVATAPQPQIAPAPPTRDTGPVSPPAPVAASAAPAIADGGNLSARLLSAKPPTYPLESRHRHEEGTVTLGVTVSVAGAVSDIAVVQSSGSSRLDQAALGAVRKWRWAPLLRDGQPVMVRGQVKIPFVLQR